MALYEFSRRQLTQEPPARWSRWWKSAVQNGKGLYIEIALGYLLDGAWVVDDVTGDKAMSFFQSQPGWLDPFDGFGTPITCKRLSPKEEYEALKPLSPERRSEMAPACSCPFEVSRDVRRMAERAFWKLYNKKFRELAR